ncbi:MAG TPA: tetratricopeptide repeat protein [Isosphaeraceae bacterium]|nr:tetratricopeptide repeat protein [Isosphaeraceae bacterium]
MRWWSVMGLSALVLMGCRTIPERLSADRAGNRKPSQEVSRSEDRGGSKRDSGLIRTQFEREERPAPNQASRLAPEAKVSTEQSISVHLDLARVLEAQDRAQDALGEYRKGIDAYREAGNRIRGNSETRARLHRKLAQAFDHLGQPEEAKSHYQMAQKLAPRDPNVWNDAGYSAFFQGRFDEAERLLKKAAALDPANPRILTNLGMTLAALDQIDPALEVLTKAGGPASAHMNLAFVLASTGRTDEARQQYRAALAIDPQLALARSAMVKLGPEKATQTAQNRIPSRAGSQKEALAR